MTRLTCRHALSGVAVLTLATATLAATGCGSSTTKSTSTTTKATTMHNGHSAMGGMHMADAHGGLAQTESGYRLNLTATTAAMGATTVRFVITAPNGSPQKQYAIDQTKRLHFYLVRKDLTGYQHLHPVQAADGTWSVPVTFTAAGPYRAYTDFVAKDPAGKPHPVVLSQQVNVAGTYTPTALPKPSTTTTVDGYTLNLTGSPQAGKESSLSFHVTRAGRPVADLQPYLDTFAHMTALKNGTLNYSHQHPKPPTQHGGLAGPDLAFAADLPTAGDYRLFLQFKTSGHLHLAQITVHAT